MAEHKKGERGRRKVSLIPAPFGLMSRGRNASREKPQRERQECNALEGRVRHGRGGRGGKEMGSSHHLLLHSMDPSPPMSQPEDPIGTSSPDQQLHSHFISSYRNPAQLPLAIIPPLHLHNSPARKARLGWESNRQSRSQDGFLRPLWKNFAKVYGSTQDL